MREIMEITSRFATAKWRFASCNYPYAGLTEKNYFCIYGCINRKVHKSWKTSTSLFIFNTHLCNITLQKFSILCFIVSRFENSRLLFRFESPRQLWRLCNDKTKSETWQPTMPYTCAAYTETDRVTLFSFLAKCFVSCSPFNAQVSENFNTISANTSIHSNKSSQCTLLHFSWLRRVAWSVTAASKVNHWLAEKEISLFDSIFHWWKVLVHFQFKKYSGSGRKKEFGHLKCSGVAKGGRSAPGGTFMGRHYGLCCRL